MKIIFYIIMFLSLNVFSQDPPCKYEVIYGSNQKNKFNSFKSIYLTLKNDSTYSYGFRNTAGCVIIGFTLSDGYYSLYKDSLILNDTISNEVYKFDIRDSKLMAKIPNFHFCFNKQFILIPLRYADTVSAKQLELDFNYKLKNGIRKINLGTLVVLKKINRKTYSNGSISFKLKRRFLEISYEGMVYFRGRIFRRKTQIEFINDSINKKEKLIFNINENGDLVIEVCQSLWPIFSLLPTIRDVPK